MRIDIHAHYYPPEYYDHLTRATGTLFETPQYGGRPIDERAALLADSKVDLQILSVGTGVQYLPHLAGPLEAARIANDALAKITADHSVFGAFGAVPLPNVEAALAEATRCLDELGMLGILVGCAIGDRSLEDPGFDMFWAELNRRRTMVLVHPVARAVEPLLVRYGVVGPVGGCVEDALAALGILSSNWTSRFPEVRVVIPHLGGTLLSVLGRLHPPLARETLRRLYYDTATGHPPLLRCAAEVLGADRLMLGTDDVGAGSLQSSVDDVLKSGLGDETTQAIMGTTASGLLATSRLRRRQNTQSKVRWRF